jgi:hypothetical protein
VRCPRSEEPRHFHHVHHVHDGVRGPAHPEKHQHGVPGPFQGPRPQGERPDPGILCQIRCRILAVRLHGGGQGLGLRPEPLLLLGQGRVGLAGSGAGPVLALWSELARGSLPCQVKMSRVPFGP